MDGEMARIDQSMHICKSAPNSEWSDSEALKQMCAQWQNVKRLIRTARWLGLRVQDFATRPVADPPVFPYPFKTDPRCLWDLLVWICWMNYPRCSQRSKYTANTDTCTLTRILSVQSIITNCIYFDNIWQRQFFAQCWHLMDKLSQAINSDISQWLKYVKKFRVKYRYSRTARNLPTRPLSLIHIWRCRRSYACRSRWWPYH